MTKIVRTPTETLMSALSECETASDCMIILVHDQDISWHSTSDSHYQKLGLVEFVATCIRDGIMRMKESDSNEKN